jgi:iron only hydrogenase large subunit-like protein
MPFFGKKYRPCRLLTGLVGVYMVLSGGVKMPDNRTVQQIIRDAMRTNKARIRRKERRVENNGRKRNRVNTPKKKMVERKAGINETNINSGNSTVEGA